MILLGIDPGIETTGYGVIEVVARQSKYIASGVVKTKSINSMASRLLELRRDILSLLDLYTPEVIAIEKLFFGVNAATAMNVAQARGVILSAVAEYKRDIPIHEYVPGTVKKAITGSGTATKSWMIKEVKRRLNIELKEDNEADSLAIALTCAQSL